MEHLGTKTLETERLILRRFTLDDAEAMYRNWASDPDVTTFLTWQPHGSADVTREILKVWVQSYEEPESYQWAVVLKELGEPIGSISGMKYSRDTNSIVIGYCIGKPWWGHGYTAEALDRLLGFFFNEVGIDCVKACHDPDNPNSGKVMRKCAMRYDGTWRRCTTNNRGVCDASWYSILKDEYRPRSARRETGDALIRRAQERDMDKIMDLLVQVCMVHHNGRPDLFKGPATKYTRAELADILKDDSTPVFVLEQNGAVQGYAFCILKQLLRDNVMTDIKTLYIDDLCVDEHARGAHVGQRLLEYVKGYAKDIGCYNVTLNVWSCNTGAMRFYENQGLMPQKIGMETILT